MQIKTPTKRGFVILHIMLAISAREVEHKLHVPSNRLLDEGGGGPYRSPLIVSMIGTIFLVPNLRKDPIFCQPAAMCVLCGVLLAMQQINEQI